jgi:hypothetical protein
MLTDVHVSYQWLDRPCMANRFWLQIVQFTYFYGVTQHDGQQGLINNAVRNTNAKDKLVMPYLNKGNLIWSLYTAYKAFLLNDVMTLTSDFN